MPSRGGLGGSSPRAMPSRGGLGGSSPRAMPSRGGLGGSSPRAAQRLGPAVGEQQDGQRGQHRDAELPGFQHHRHRPEGQRAMMDPVVEHRVQQRDADHRGQQRPAEQQPPDRAGGLAPGHYETHRQADQGRHGPAGSVGGPLVVPGQEQENSARPEHRHGQARRQQRDAARHGRGRAEPSRDGLGRHSALRKSGLTRFQLRENGHQVQPRSSRSLRGASFITWSQMTPAVPRRSAAGLRPVPGASASPPGRRRRAPRIVRTEGFSPDTVGR